MTSVIEIEVRARTVLAPHDDIVVDGNEPVPKTARSNTGACGWAVADRGEDLIRGRRRDCRQRVDDSNGPGTAAERDERVGTVRGHRFDPRNTWVDARGSWNQGSTHLCRRQIDNVDLWPAPTEVGARDDHAAGRGNGFKVVVHDLNVASCAEADRGDGRQRG